MTAPTVVAEPTGDSSVERIVKVAISACVLAADTVRAAVTRRSRWQRWSGVVLLYHGVRPADAGRFEAQLRRAGQVGRFVPLDEVVAEPDGTCRVAVTFDDALESFQSVALPVMERLHVPSAVFVPTAVVGGVPSWWGAPTEHVLDARAIAALPASVSVGSHSRTHPHLTTVADDRLDAEVRGSADDLAGVMGTPVRHFAYPFGDHSARVVAAVTHAGYERSWTVDPAPVSASDGAVHGRVTVEPWEWPIELRLKLAGAYRWTAWIMRRRRRRAEPVGAVG